MKKAYISGEKRSKGFLGIFEEAEYILEKAGAIEADDRDVQLARRIDNRIIKYKRRENADVLRAAFPDWLIFPLMMINDCPMFVPVLIPNGKRDELRNYLINKSIYCPVHWPISEYHRLTEEERFIYDNEMSIVCDQRYTPDDMNRIVETIKQFMEV